MRRDPLRSRTLDLPHLARQTFGDRALERELLALFEQQCLRLLPIVGGGGPPIECADAAHTLKGAARAVGAWRVAELCDSLEMALDEMSASETIDRLMLKLDNAVRDVRAAAALHWRDAA